MLKQRSKEKMGSYQQSDEDEEPEKKKIKLEPAIDEEVSYSVPDNTNNWPIDVNVELNSFYIIMTRGQIFMQ